MSACRSWRNHLVEAVYGELAGERRRDFESHLDGCPGCRNELAGFEVLTRRIDEALPPRPRPGELNVWRRLAPELDALDRPPARRRALVLGYPAAAALAAALLVLGVGVGQFWRTPVATVTPEAPTAASEADVDLEFARFLERSTPLLLAVANRRIGAVETAGFDPAAERRRAERLASDAVELAGELDDAGRRRQADLLRDLNVVFLQLSNLPEHEYRHGIELVQATIESRALIFQLSVEEMRRL